MTSRHCAGTGWFGQVAAGYRLRTIALAPVDRGAVGIQCTYVRESGGRQDEGATLVDLKSGSTTSVSSIAKSDDAYIGGSVHTELGGVTDDLTIRGSSAAGTGCRPGEIKVVDVFQGDVSVNECAGVDVVEPKLCIIEITVTVIVRSRGSFHGFVCAKWNNSARGLACHAPASATHGRRNSGDPFILRCSRIVGALGIEDKERHVIGITVTVLVGETSFRPRVHDITAVCPNDSAGTDLRDHLGGKRRIIGNIDPAHKAIHVVAVAVVVDVSRLLRRGKDENTILDTHLFKRVIRFAIRRPQPRIDGSPCLNIVNR